MPIADKHSVFYRAHAAWGRSDLEGYLAFLTDDVVHAVNIEGQEVPYAIGTQGKAALRARLQLLLDTFVIDAFVVEDVVNETEFSRSRVLGYYKHRKTGERLDMKMRFQAWEKDGQFYRVEEFYDAAYLEAFERFVTHLQAAAEAQTAGPGADAGPSPEKKTNGTP
jgi:ketosteroid isomerase-like protein